ncbi:MAG: methionine ABC transporter permease [Cellulosilyticum sp.]|nr:ABC transporter permease [Cellulosilyticum sp.]MEE1072100.1 methionine ABC transporter permease [Cellulosilyticum sp.]
MWDSTMFEMLGKGIGETLYMTLFSTLLAYVIGLPLGIALVVTEKESLLPNKWVNSILNIIVNITRSVPFLILLVFIQPLTRAIVGTAIGSTATIVPLVVAAAPFIGRMVESSIKELDKGVIEAALSMGASPLQIIWKVMLPETKPSLWVGAAISSTTILGYSAMAGFTSGGGLGDIAIRYGYNRYQTDVMFVTVVLLVVIVQVLQGIGMKIASKQDKRK